MSYGAGTPTTTAAAPTLGSGMSGWEKGGLLGAGGLGLGALFGLGGEQESFGGGTPQSYLGQVPDILKKYFAPYQGLVEDPTAKLGEIGSHYTQSPGYHFALQQALKVLGPRLLLVEWPEVLNSNNKLRGPHKAWLHKITVITCKGH